MGKNNKNKKKQPFIMFVHDWKRREERRGRVFPGGLPEAIKMAGPFWETLQPETKARYKEEASAYNEWQSKRPQPAYNGVRATPPKPQTTYRPPVNNELDFIKNYVHSKSITKLLDEPFYLIHVNVYTITSDGEVFPAELSVAEFTLRAGVSRVFHRFFSAGKLPMGYEYTVREHSRKTHRIPIDFVGKETGYLGLYAKLCAFLKEDKKEMPCLYTMPNEPHRNFSFTAVRNTLKRIWETGNEEDEEDGEVSDIEPWQKVFKLLPLHYLFYELKNKCATFNDPTGIGFSNTALASNELIRDYYCHDQDIACRFHREEDAVQWCSQSITVRWARLIKELCLTHLVDEKQEHEQKPDVSQIKLEKQQPEQSSPTIKQENIKVEKIDHRPIKEENVKREKDSATVQQEKPSSSTATVADTQQPSTSVAAADTTRIKTEKPDVPTIKQEKCASKQPEVITIKTERPEATATVKTERNRGYADETQKTTAKPPPPPVITIEEERSRNSSESVQSVKEERSRGYGDESSSSSSPPPQSIKSERNRGYVDEPRPRPSSSETTTNIKQERQTESSSEATPSPTVKPETPRGYADERRTIKEERTEESGNGQPPPSTTTVVIKNERNRGYADESSKERTPQTVTIKEEHRQSEDVTAAMKNERNRGYADERRSPPPPPPPPPPPLPPAAMTIAAATVKQERTATNSTEGTPSLTVKSERNRGYVDEPAASAAAVPVKSEGNRGYTDEVPQQEDRSGNSNQRAANGVPAVRVKETNLNWRIKTEESLRKDEDDLSSLIADLEDECEFMEDDVVSTDAANVKVEPSSSRAVTPPPPPSSVKRPFSNRVKEEPTDEAVAATTPGKRMKSEFDSVFREDDLDISDTGEGHHFLEKETISSQSSVNVNSPHQDVYIKPEPMEIHEPTASDSGDVLHEEYDVDTKPQMKFNPMDCEEIDVASAAPIPPFSVVKSEVPVKEEKECKDDIFSAQEDLD